MTPTEAIETVVDKGGLVSKLNEMLYRLDGEAREIAEEWAILGQMGGQRDDHAAMLLARLRPHLAEIASFAKNCEQQITGMVADPFGRTAAAPDLLADLLADLQECITENWALAFASQDFYKAKQRLMAINNIARAAIAKAEGK